VILLDVVLGYGSHPDPAAEIVPVLKKIKKKRGSPVIVASVCGTDEDPQGLERQEAALREAGVLLAESNARAARLAGAIAAKLA
jgi:L-asparaginase/Glu-tRNA(Gln) amidotransferase subunit D